MNRIAYFLIVIIVVSALCWYMLDAQSMDVPISIQTSLFSKILTFDRNLANRVGNRIVIGVLYQKMYHPSSVAKDELTKAFETQGINEMGGIPLRYELIDLSSDVDLEQAIDQNGINIIYVTPLRAVNLEKITELSQSKRILTLTGVSEYGNQGISVSIGIKGDRPQIIINLLSAKAEGADFNSQFLKIVRVIQ